MKISQGTKRYLIAIYLENLALQNEGIDLGIKIKRPMFLDEVKPRFTPLTSTGPIEPILAQKQLQLDTLLKQEGFLRADPRFILQGKEISHDQEAAMVHGAYQAERIPSKIFERTEWLKSHPDHLFPIRLLTPQELNSIGIPMNTLTYKMARYLEEDFYKKNDIELWGKKELVKSNFVPLPKPLAKSFPQIESTFNHAKQEQIDRIFRMYGMIQE